MASILFNRKTAFLSLVILNFGLDAKFSSKRAVRVQQKQLYFTKKANQALDYAIRAYGDELSVLKQDYKDLNDQIKNLIVNKPDYQNANYPLLDYRNDLLWHISRLDHVKDNRFISDELWLEVSQIQENLMSIDTVLAQDTDYLTQRKDRKMFWKKTIAAVIIPVICIQLGVVLGTWIILQFGSSAAVWTPYTSAATANAIAASLAALFIYLDVKALSTVAKI